MRIFNVSSLATLLQAEYGVYASHSLLRFVLVVCHECYSLKFPSKTQNVARMRLHHLHRLTLKRRVRDPRNPEIPMSAQQGLLLKF